jgi:PAP2 superfamily C-terminal
MPTTLLNDNWKDTWGSPYKRRQIIFGSVIMLLIVFMLPLFFNHIEKRKGTLLNDWLLAQIPPHNVSVLIFAVIWGMILLILYRAIYHPSIYINYCWALILVSLARLTCISLVPLSPPQGLIPLTDPITGIFYGESNITKDLFFSGHVATLTLIFLCLEIKSDKIIAFFAIIVVAVLLEVQHIHYSIDILAAPVITYLCFLVTRYFLHTKQRAII